MRLIITRPEADAKPLSDRLATLGHTGIVLPLLKIMPRASVTLPDTAWQAVCFTSGNGPRALPANAKLQNLPVFTVGQQSLIEAKHNGYVRASAHGGDVNGLSHYIVKHLKPENGPILYVSGAETSGDLQGKLKAAGFTVHREIVYDTVPHVPEGLAGEISEAQGVLLYSPRTTQHWLSALQKTKLLEDASRLKHFCLSANVAAKLPKHFDFAVAATPDEGGMLALLDQQAEAE